MEKAKFLVELAETISVSGPSSTSGRRQAAFISIITGVPIENRNRTAITGSMTITGGITDVGGVFEKVVAAFTSRIEYVLMPEENVEDLRHLNEEIRNRIKIVSVRTFSELHPILFPTLV